MKLGSFSQLQTAAWPKSTELPSLGCHPALSGSRPLAGPRSDCPGRLIGPVDRTGATRPDSGPGRQSPRPFASLPAAIIAKGRVVCKCRQPTRIIRPAGDRCPRSGWWAEARFLETSPSATGNGGRAWTTANFIWASGRPHGKAVDMTAFGIGSSACAGAVQTWHLGRHLPPLRLGADVLIRCR